MDVFKANAEIAIQRKPCNKDDVSVSNIYLYVVWVLSGGDVGKVTGNAKR